MSTATRAAEGLDYDRFCDGVKALCDIDLAQYRRAQMERRLRAFAGRAGHEDLDCYLAALRRDAPAREAFLDHMTINVSELFRNPERFRELESAHLPELLAAAPGRGLRVWSAGCSDGAEPYTLAILLAEAAPGVPHELTATDIDRAVLARAREGVFREQDLRGVSAARRRRWFAALPGGGWRANAELRAAVRFSAHDLLADPFPRNRDLIVCRNVVIYLTEDATAGIHDRFFAALRPSGMLFVGSTERIGGAGRPDWERLGPFVGRRPAVAG